MTKYAHPEDAEAAFYRAFELCDLPAMTRIWQPYTNITCIHPGGQLLQGEAAVMESWGAILSEAQPPQVQFRLLHRLRSNELAVHTVEEMIRPGDSDTPSTRLIATNIYHLGDAGWQMVAHHACLPMMQPSQTQRGPVH